MTADPFANGTIGLQHRYGAHRKVAVHAVRTSHPVLEETLFELKSQGSVETVPQTGARVYAGYDALVPGQYSVTIGIWAGSRTDQARLRSEVVQDARRCRSVVSGGLTLLIASYSTITPAWRGSSLLGSTVKAVFEPASAYWLRSAREQFIPPGAPVAVTNAGDMPAGLRLSITAGASAVTNPSVMTDAGLTAWTGTIPAGQTLVIDATPGVWSTTLGGVDAHLGLSGRQPRLNPGSTSITVLASGATAVAAWQEGTL